MAKHIGIRSIGQRAVASAILDRFARCGCPSAEPQTPKIVVDLPQVAYRFRLHTAKPHVPLRRDLSRSPACVAWNDLSAQAQPIHHQIVIPRTKRPSHPCDASTRRLRQPLAEEVDRLRIVLRCGCDILSHRIQLDAFLCDLGDV